MIMTVGAELKRWPRAGVAPWSDHPKGCLVHSRKRIDPTKNFLIIIEHLLLFLSVEHCRRVDREYMARIHPGLGLLQCEQSGHQHARACEQNEGCSDLCDDENALPTLAAADLPAAA